MPLLSARIRVIGSARAAGELTDVYLPAVTDGNPNDSTFNESVAPHWHYTYDAGGNEISQTDPDGHTTTFGCDEQGNRISRTLPDGESEDAEKESLLIMDELSMESGPERFNQLLV